MSSLPTLNPFDFALPASVSPSETNPETDGGIASNTHQDCAQFGSPALDASPEHTYFGTTWTSDSPHVTNGLNQFIPVGANGAFIDTVPSTPQDGIPLDTLPWQTMPETTQYGTLPVQSLSHASSFSSLHSVSSANHSFAGSTNGLFVDFPPENTDFAMGHSRHSSYVLDDKPQEGYDLVPSINSWTMPIGSNTARETPSLQLQTQGLGRAMVTARSATRIQPYNRERSTSLSVKSEDEEVDALLSTTTSYSQQQTPWSTTSSHPLVGGLNRMTLHHRRTSSNTSTFANSPIRPTLTRAHRSSSLATAKSFDKPDIILTGSAEDRERTVRDSLTQRAAVYKATPPGSQQDKARSAWVRAWLQLSYTSGPGSTVPRQGLYHSYTLSCEEYGTRPINSASFGKAVRSAYPGIKTRRLGHRGNSKYHYVALRPAIRIEAERLNEYGDSSGRWHVAPEDGAMGFHPSTNDEDMDGEDVDDTELDEEEEDYMIKKTPSSVDIRAQRPLRGSVRRHTTSMVPTLATPFESIVPVYSLPGFPSWTDLQGATPEARAFWESFCHQQELLASCVRGLKFDQFEINCRTFWAGRSPSEMYACEQNLLSSMIDNAMAKAYDHFLSILVGKLDSQMTVSAQNSLRTLAQNLEAIVEESMANFSPEFCEPKIELSVRAGHLMQRFADVHQLSTALNPILSNRDQISTMIDSWDRLNTRAVSDQCALSCNCQPNFLLGMMAEFRQWLLDASNSTSNGQLAIGRLGKWVNKILNEVTQSACTGQPPPTRSIISRAGFITSQIMRDFTLKSDPAFGLFQLIKTWVDDWISLWVLRQTALIPSSLGGPNPVLPEMSVMIPSQGSTFPNDLSTAVPFPFTHRLNTISPTYEPQSQSLSANMATRIANTSGGCIPAL